MNRSKMLAEKIEKLQISAEEKNRLKEEVIELSAVELENRYSKGGVKKG